MKRGLLKKCIVLTTALSMLSMGIVANADESYTVQSGDNLSKIAKVSYGDSAQWKTIYEANKDSIKKPDLIYKGQVLTLPGVAEAAPAVENVETPAPEAVTTETEAPAVVETEVSEAPVETQAPVQAATPNNPVGNNPVIDENGYEVWTFMDGSNLTVTRRNKEHLLTATGACDITYRELVSGGNAEAMKQVARYAQENPKFASLIEAIGHQIVITSGIGMWDDVYDYDYYLSFVECEQKDGLYLFVSYDPDLTNEATEKEYWDEVLSYLVSSIEEITGGQELPSL